MSRSIIEGIWSGRKVIQNRLDIYGNVVGSGVVGLSLEGDDDEDGSGPSDEREIEDAEDAGADAPEGFDSVESLDG